MVQTINSAVYNARGLYGMYEPAFNFDDINLCNAVGVYKNGSGNNEGLFDGENNYLTGLQPKVISNKMEVNAFEIYPNPSSMQIIISYKLTEHQSGKFILYDILCIEKINIDLNDRVNKVVVNVSNLRQGLYTYKFTDGSKLNTTGKLLID
jgi:hypothetical protein